MRDRTRRPQMITIRPLEEPTTDVFGDVSIMSQTHRAASFRMKGQVTHTGGLLFDDGRPGRSISYAATVMLRKRDVPAAAPVDWSPSSNDLFDLADGRKLFVVDVQPAYPKKISIRNPNGGFAGWRVTLSDRQPTLSAADQYES
jgi:hypothetical protein